MKFSYHQTLILFLLALTPLTSFCHEEKKKKKETPVIERVDPPFWWADMANSHLEISVYGKGIQSFSEVKLEEPTSKIVSITKPQNPNYLFIKLDITGQKPGFLTFYFSNPTSKKTVKYRYEIQQRHTEGAQGLSHNDVIYMVFPDRFSNGDTTNDAYADMNEKVADRKALKLRHGGDIQGIINHLDYIENLGMTALWVNPVLENNQTKESYHGYAATDLYKIDRRFGSNTLYKTMVKECHNRKMKVVWDVVYNHWGIDNWMYQDLPDSSWIHWFKNFTRTNYRAETLMDPYASEADKKLMSDAWFDQHMPDLNQKDEHLAAYLIQNSIWWIEYSGIDAFRIDTYAYPDQLFMKNLNEAIRKEYPNFFIFGETWVQGTPVQAWFTEKNGLNKTYSSSMQGVTDFQLYFAMMKGLNEPFGWEEGLRRIELILGHDYQYADARNNVTHLDNHDLTRFYTSVGEDFSKWKIGLGMLLTLRGIPQIYYGTEILMKNAADPDAKVREDFPGGWPHDSVNKFHDTERSPKEQEAFTYLNRILQWRKANSWFGDARTTQFVPDNNTYVYFRHSEQHSVMVIINLNESNYELPLSRFDECLKGAQKGKNISTEESVILGDKLILAPKSIQIIELR